MEALIFLTSFTFLFGLALGSFLNVVIYRVPRHESIVFPASHCPKCNRNLKPWENIPVLSYLFLRGKCYGCKAHISIQYPLVELLTGLTFLIVVLQFGFSFKSIVYIVFTAILIILSVIDFHTKLLPDVFTFPGAAAAFLLSLATLHPMVAKIWSISPFQSFMGALAGAGPLALIAWLYFRFAKREGLGCGDIKLMIFVGALLGPAKAALALFLGAFTGTLVGIPSSLAKGGGRYTEIPFGPFLSLAAWIAAIWGDSIIRWYMQFSGIIQ